VSLWRRLQEHSRQSQASPLRNSGIRAGPLLRISEERCLLRAPNSFACGWSGKEYLTRSRRWHTELRDRERSARWRSRQAVGPAADWVDGALGGGAGSCGGQLPACWWWGSARLPCTAGPSQPRGETPRRPASLPEPPAYVFNRFVVGGRTAALATPPRLRLAEGPPAGVQNPPLPLWWCGPGLTTDAGAIGHYRSRIDPTPGCFTSPPRSFHQRGPDPRRSARNACRKFATYRAADRSWSMTPVSSKARVPPGGVSSTLQCLHEAGRSDVIARRSPPSPDSRFAGAAISRFIDWALIR